MQFENLNAIVDFAIEKEKEAAEFYEAASKEESMSGSKEMLLGFAQEERKHEDMLEKFKSGSIDESVSDYQLKWIKDIRRSDYVVEMEYKKGMGYPELLMLAMKREEAALKLYNELQDNSESEDVKKIFKVLCQEEAKHKLALETMYDDHMAKVGD
ncbi:MAG: rubrerythrin [Desulfobacteraceae bacterium 4572_88]|nr:MAG: rubrerythrin [Desulfobacteraceae bacterium 4572_88]